MASHSPSALGQDSRTAGVEAGWWEPWGAERCPQPLARPAGTGCGSGVIASSAQVGFPLRRHPRESPPSAGVWRGQGQGKAGLSPLLTSARQVVVVLWDNGRGMSLMLCGEPSLAQPDAGNLVPGTC